MSFKKIVSWLAAVALAASAVPATSLAESTVETDLVKLSDDFEAGYTVGSKLTDSAKYSAGSMAYGVWGEVQVREKVNGDVGSIRVSEEDGNKVIEFYSGDGLVSAASPRMQKIYEPSASDVHKALVNFSMKKTSTADEVYVLVSVGGVSMAKAMCLKGVNAIPGDEKNPVNIGANAWHKYMLLIDFDNWTSTLYVDGAVLFSDASMGGTARPANFSTITVGFSDKIQTATKGQSALLDNVTMIDYKQEYAAEVQETGAAYVIMKTSTLIDRDLIQGEIFATGTDGLAKVTSWEYVNGNPLTPKLTFDRQLSPETNYSLDLSGVPDVFGRAKTQAVSFKTKARALRASLPTLHRSVALGGGLITMLESGELSAQANIENTLEQDKEVVLLNVLYDENGTVEDIAEASQSIPTGASVTISTGAVNVGETSQRTIKLFLIDSLTGLTPLTSSVQYGVGTPATPADAARELSHGIRETDIVDLDAKTAEIYVTLADSAPGQRVGVLVLDTESKMEYYNESVSNANGVCTIKFSISEEKEYIVLAVSGNQHYTASFYYVTPETAASALAAVNAASGTDALLTAMQTLGQGLMVNLEYMNSLTLPQQKSIMDMMLNFKKIVGGAFASPAAAASAYRRAEALMRIGLAATATEVAAIINEKASTLGFETYDTYKNIMTDGGRDVVNTTMLNTEAITGLDMISAFHQKVILAGVFKADQWADVKTILTRHYNLVGLSEQTVLAAGPSVFKGMLGKDYSDLPTLKSVFEAATAVKSTGSGVSTGGGGGSRIVTDIPMPVATPQPEITSPSQSTEYTDLDSVPWAKESILALSRLGIVQGNGGGKFAPETLVTREEIVKMLINSFGLLNADAMCDFADVSKDAWYYSFVASANQLGITKGIGGGSFGIGLRVTRQDMAALVYAAAKLAGVGFQATHEPAFSDGDEIADYAKESIFVLYGAGLIAGMEDGRFAPEEQCTRAQAAKVIYGALRLKP